MFDEKELDTYFVRMNLGEDARAVIRHIRSTQPSRAVGSGKCNVVCRFASKKMGRTIQAESHTNELAAVWRWEHDPRTHEFWDQPPAVPLKIVRRDGHPCGYLKTADYFLLNEDYVGWVECKPEAWLRQAVTDGDQNYYQDEQGVWHYRPGECYAEQFGLGFRVRLAEENNTVLVDNLKFLSEYLDEAAQPVTEDSRKSILRLFEAPGWHRLYDLTHADPAIDADHLYKLIADGVLYFYHERDRLSEPSRTYIFRDHAAAEAYDLFSRSVPREGGVDVSAVELVPGKRIVWDAVTWTIANAGEREYFLVDDRQHSITLSVETLNQLIAQGKVLADPEALSAQSERARERLMHASEVERAEAANRYRAIHANPDEPCPAAVPERTLREWRRAFRRGIKLYGNGFLGLLTNKHQRGNRRRKLGQTVIDIIRKVIETRYNSGEARTIKAAWGIARLQCRAAGVPPPSEKSFSLEIRRLFSNEDLTRVRFGDKAAYSTEPWIWRLEDSSPRHGQRPFELGHIDHTEIDLQLIDERFDRVIKTRKCWVTAMIDAYSRVILAIYVTFDEPSYRSNMAVIRECIRRHGRIPATLVVDWGSDFRGKYFEELLAYLETHKKHRPKGSPRHGALIESLFNRTNLEFLHQLRGNNQALQNPRSLSKTHDPRERTVWTIGAFTEAFEKYLYDVYPTQIHGTLGVAPRQAFELGLRDFGPRKHRRIVCDETFRMMCLPSTREGRAKVQPGGRLKINSIQYHSPALNLPMMRERSLDVRYDPFDMSRAYAYADGAWVELRSEYAGVFSRYTEREIDAISKEIRQRHSETYKNREINGEVIARYMLAVEQTEARLLGEKGARKKASGASEAPDLTLITQPIDVDDEKDPFAGIVTEDYGDAE